MAKTKEERILIQVRVPKSMYKALVGLMAAAGDISMSAYTRRVLTGHVEESHGKK
jgi:hypothetical protein